MTLLIVDDQPHVVSGILLGVNWRRCGVSHVLKANSAAEARALIRAHPVDVLLCDIEMPEESGLSLIAWVRKSGYDMACILLTAHADFDYARQALKLDSYDYIVQPAPYERIEQAVKVAGDQLSKNREDARMTHYGEMVFDRRDRLIQMLLSEWVVGTCPSSAQLVSDLRSLDVPLCLDSIMIVGLLWADEESSTDSLAMLLQTAVDDCADGAKLHTLITPLPHSQGEYAFVVFAKKDQEDGARILSAVDGLAAHLASQYGLAVGMVTTKELIRVDQVPEAFSRLRADREQFPKGDGKASAPANEESSQVVLCEQTESEQISIIVQYVRDNIEKDIRRSDIASVVYLSPTYISRLFSEHMGVPLKEFIIQEKMKMARTLIRTTNLPISVIATKVGYSNFSHFSQTYRRQWGISPSSQRERELL